MFVAIRRGETRDLDMIICLSDNKLDWIKNVEWIETEHSKVELVDGELIPRPLFEGPGFIMPPSEDQIAQANADKSQQDNTQSIIVTLLEEQNMFLSKVFDEECERHAIDKSKPFDEKGELLQWEDLQKYFEKAISSFLTRETKIKQVYSKIIDLATSLEWDVDECIEKAKKENALQLKLIAMPNE